MLAIRGRETLAELVALVHPEHHWLQTCNAQIAPNRHAQVRQLTTSPLRGRACGSAQRFQEPVKPAGVRQPMSDHRAKDRAEARHVASAWIHRASSVVSRTLLLRRWASRSRVPSSGAVTQTRSTLDPAPASRSARSQSLSHAPVASTDTTAWSPTARRTAVWTGSNQPSRGSGPCPRSSRSRTTSDGAAARGVGVRTRVLRDRDGGRSSAGR